MKWALGVALATGLLLPLTLDGFKPWASLGFFLAAWIALAVLTAFVDRLRHGQGSLGQKLATLPRGFWGMQLAHFGMAVGVAGIAVVANYATERDVRMDVGSYAELAATPSPSAAQPNTTAPTTVLPAARSRSARTARRSPSSIRKSASTTPPAWR